MKTPGSIFSFVLANNVKKKKKIVHLPYSKVCFIRLFLLTGENESEPLAVVKVVLEQASTEGETVLHCPAALRSPLFDLLISLGQIIFSICLRCIHIL